VTAAGPARNPPFGLRLPFQEAVWDKAPPCPLELRPDFAIPAAAPSATTESGVDVFPTNDRRFERLTNPGIHFIAGMDVNLF